MCCIQLYIFFCSVKYELAAGIAIAKKEKLKLEAFLVNRSRDVMMNL